MRCLVPGVPTVPGTQQAPSQGQVAEQTDGRRETEAERGPARGARIRASWWGRGGGRREPRKEFEQGQGRCQVCFRKMAAGWRTACPLVG